MNFENQIIKVFQNTTNSYKYYWWYSILQLVKSKKSKKIQLDDVAFQMIILSWYPVNYFKISLGKQDQLANYIRELKNQFNELTEDIKEVDLELFLIQNKNHPTIKEIIQNLIKYVPYRFIRPWFEETIGMKDAIVNFEILKLQEYKNAPYRIYGNTSIDINEEWYNWICSNILLVESFTFYELFKYIEKNNPYVNNISIKLFKPQTRKLSTPTKLWKEFILNSSSGKMSVFENKPLISMNNMAIDHYLPWSLVTHDKLWNLHPIEQDVNSSKSNKIADSKYVKPYTNLQFNFVSFLTLNNSKYLEDYFTLFSISKNELLQLPFEKFNEILSNKIQIETDSAVNLGYYTKWINPIQY